MFSQSEESCVCVDADDVAIGGTMDVWVAGTGWDNVVAGTGSEVLVIWSEARENFQRFFICMPLEL